ncbi:MAG: hypothetical protein SFU25_07435 [Candidatus Caenarcaniphilales bacterium]|nr:hypothetical protein [Candidatus Caenarcaniphilales bacterium]
MDETTQRVATLNDLSDAVQDTANDLGLQAQEIKPFIDGINNAKSYELLYGTQNAQQISNLQTSMVLYEIRDTLVEAGRSDLWTQQLEAFHGKLQFFGLAPAYGEAFDLLDGIVYAFEGKPKDAGFSFGSAVPGLGYGFFAARKGIKYAPDFMKGAGKFGDDAFEAAKNGGKHSGTLKNYANKTNEELQQALESYKKQVEIHKNKIANPEKYVLDWSNKDIRYQQGVIKYWEKDIEKNYGLSKVIEGMLRERGL